jgi:hypothetical protein
VATPSVTTNTLPSNGLVRGSPPTCLNEDRLTLDEWFNRMISAATPDERLVIEEVVSRLRAKVKPVSL